MIVQRLPQIFQASVSPVFPGISDKWVIFGCFIAIAVAFATFGQSDPQTYARVGGMLTGLYTGGTANQASIKMALGVPDETYLLSHAYSIVISAVYLFFVIIFGKRTLSPILPPFDRAAAPQPDDTAIEDHSDEPLYGLLTKANRPHLIKALAITAAIIAAGAAVAFTISRLSSADTFQPVFILAISLLAVIASLNRKIATIQRTFELGTYFILVFSIAVSSQVNIDILDNVNPDFFYFITIATLGTLLFHVLLNAILRIDTDTTLVTSISLICSPPFVPVMAGALANKAVIGPGIAVGLIGYATGTYLGFTLAHILLAFA